MIKSIWEKIKLSFERKPAGEILKTEQVVTVEPTKEVVVKVRKPRVKKEKPDANNT
jgi:hypothetical protein